MFEFLPEFLQNPVNVALLAVLGYLVYQEAKPVAAKPRPKAVPSEKKVIEQKDFTPKELAKFNGVGGAQIYLSILGKVYDVSAKPDFYGPGSMYENFSGRDASRGMAKHSFEKDMLTDLDKQIDELKDLNAEERQALKEWSEFFDGKYDVVGRLVNEASYCYLASSNLEYDKHQLPFPNNQQCPVKSPQIEPSKLVAANRKRLRHVLASLFPEALERKAILLPSAQSVLRDESDMELPGWRQTSNIYYVLGKFSMPDVFLLVKLEESGSLSFDLVLPSYNTREIVFNGNYPNKTELVQQFNLNGVYQVSELASLTEGLDLVTSSKDWDQRVIPGSLVTPRYSVAAEQLFIESRFIKTKEELEMLEFSSKIASFAHQVVQETIANISSSESKLASLFTYISTVCGCELQAYNPIVGAAKHGAILHFPTGQSFDDGMTLIEKRDFVLIDAGPAYRGYASDLTRTYTAKATDKFTVLSKIVLNAQMAGIGAYKKGNKWSKVVNKTLEKLTEGLWKAGFFLAPDLNTLVDSGVISILMPHGIGHPIGLDVHDPYPSSVKNAPSSSPLSITGLRDQYPLKLAYDYELAIGMAHTIEPGVYFIPYLLDLAKNNDSMGVSSLIDWDVIKEWQDVGGVRIEDVIVIDYEGYSKIITHH